MSHADFVVVMARVSPETIGLVGAEQIALMKPTAYFINTARPQLVDNAALLAALKQGKIRGAALDVFEREPLPADSEWFKLPLEKLIMTPHQSGLSVERDNSHSEAMTKCILEYLRGEVPGGLMNHAVFDSPAFASRGGKLFGIEKR
jgi:D-3-phosphoglycerate dehydrogenase / 2-oxoglutarate reductase